MATTEISAADLYIKVRLFLDLARAARLRAAGVSDEDAAERKRKLQDRRADLRSKLGTAGTAGPGPVYPGPGDDGDGSGGAGYGGGEDGAFGADGGYPPFNPGGGVPDDPHHQGGGSNDPFPAGNQDTSPGGVIVPPIGGGGIIVVPWVQADPPAAGALGPSALEAMPVEPGQGDAGRSQVRDVTTGTVGNPTTFFDYFNDPYVHSEWTADRGTFSVASGALSITAGAGGTPDALLRYTPGSFVQNAVYASAVLLAVGANTKHAVYILSSYVGGKFSGYIVLGNTTEVHLYRVDLNVPVSLASDVGLTNGATLALYQAAANTLTVAVDGATVFTAVDATYADGYSGLGRYAAGAGGDQFDQFNARPAP